MADVNRWLDRRRFLRQTIGGQRPVSLSCAQLYIRYVDALGGGDAERFVASVRRQVASASDVILIDREWLAREDFARALQRALRPTLPARTSRSGVR